MGNGTGWTVEIRKLNGLRWNGRTGKKVDHICLIDPQGRVFANKEITKWTNVEAATAKFQQIAGASS